VAFMRIGFTERIGRIDDEIPDPPAIPGWRLVDPEDIPDGYRGEVLIVAMARKGTSLFGRTAFTPTADAFYLPED
jgi:hypothetical protein